MTESIKKELEQDIIKKDSVLTIQNQVATIDSLLSHSEQLEEIIKETSKIALKIIQRNCPEYENIYKSNFPELTEKELIQNIITKWPKLTAKNLIVTIDSLSKHHDQLRETLKKRLKSALKIIQENCPNYQELMEVPELLNTYNSLFSKKVGIY